MSPSMTLEKNDSFSGSKGTNETLKQASDNLKNLALKKGIQFINLFEEMSNAFYKHNIHKPSDIIGRDGIHHVEYSFITRTVLKNIVGGLALNIDKQDYREISAVGCPYIETNIKTKQSTNAFQSFSNFGYVYWGDALVKGSNYYVKLKLNVLVPNMNLRMHFIINNKQGTLIIKDNGVESATIDLNVNESEYNNNLTGSCATIVENLSLGYHEILISTENLTKGSSYLENPTLSLEGFSLEKSQHNKTLMTNGYFMATDSHKTRKIVDYPIEIKGKTVINIEGLFGVSTGINLFMKYENSNANATPLKLNFLSNKVALNVYKYKSNTLITSIEGTNTIDLNKSHRIKLIFDTNKIECYVDGAKELEYTRDSVNKLSGYITFWCLNVGAEIELNNMNINYISLQ